MKQPVINFYVALCNYLESATDDAKAVSQILAIAKKIGLSRTLSEIDLKMLWRIRGTQMDQSEVDELMIAAFKDLSVIKNPEALKVFQRLQLIVDSHELIMFPSKILRRKSGNAGIVTLHISNLVTFVAFLESASVTMMGDVLDRGTMVYPKAHLPIE